MKTHKRLGRGRLVPTRPTGVEYRVNYGIQMTPPERKHGRGPAPTKWEKCVVKSEAAHRIPSGEYFLHADEGGVFQVKYTGSRWEYLAAA